MEQQNPIAKASVNIDAPAEKVWQALVDPAQIKKYMFGTTVTSDWKAGSPITWKGEWKGKAYEDKGKILQLKENELLQYSHYSPLTGKPDEPESYHTVTIKLQDKDGQTALTLEQDKNANEEERGHSEENWKMMLEGIKKMLEEG